MALTFGCVCGLVVLLLAARPSEGSGASSCGGKEVTLVLLDIANYCMSKAKDMFPTCTEDDASFNPSGCGKKEMSVAYLEMAKELISKSEENYPKCERSKSEETRQTYSWWNSYAHEIHTTEADENSESTEMSFSLWEDATASPMDSTTPVEDATEATITPSRPKPRDCTGILENGQEGSSVYSIWISGTPHEVYCDMDTDGGGWTVIQRRGNFEIQEDFYRGWDSYKMGFGSIRSEFWLGNEKIHAITNQSDYEARFDLEDENGDRRFAMYDSFWIDGESSSYTLHINGYSGNAGDSMAYHDNHPFSTMDSINNKCAVERRAGWWYDYCTESNLNGVYQPGIEDRAGITWYSLFKHYSLAGSEIKIRRKKHDQAVNSTAQL